MQDLEIKNILSQEGLVIVFAFASAGLGHLRDTDALKDGLPDGVSSLILNPGDEPIRFIHRFTSVSPLARRIMEFMQNGLPQSIFTFFYRRYLRRSGKTIKNEFLQLINKKKPKTLLIMATHFGLAHQVAAIKEDIEKETGCKIVLVVQVTDDSPQYIWYVDGADLTFVTSEYVKRGLTEYGRKKHLPEIKMEINSYPLNPSLSVSLTEEEIKNKKEQANPSSSVPIHVSVPISGAAVGTWYILGLMKKLHRKSNRFIFHVVSKIAPYTKGFLAKLKDKDYIKVYVSDKDKEVVDLYEEVIKKNVVLLEITKPSEQAFKAVLEPRVRGGVLMLFTRPVGRQEYENLDFLVKRGLIPSLKGNNKLWLTPFRGKEYTDNIANLCAGMRVPFEPNLNAKFIWWCLNKRIFAKMLLCDKKIKRDNYPNELRGDGVKLFWEKVARFLAS